MFQVASFTVLVKSTSDFYQLLQRASHYSLAIEFSKNNDIDTEYEFIKFLFIYVYTYKTY